MMNAELGFGRKVLQVLEDGRLTDAKGRMVDFRNTIISMTSNVGAANVGKHKAVGFGVENPAKRA